MFGPVSRKENTREPVHNFRYRDRMASRIGIALASNVWLELAVELLLMWSILS